MGGSIRVFFRFLSNEPKASALWATLAFWSLNISLAVTARADYHAVFLRLKNLLVHFSPRAEILVSFFSVFQHTSGHPTLPYSLTTVAFSLRICFIRANLFDQSLPRMPQLSLAPFRNRSNSVFRTLQPFPALVPLILPSWRYFT